MERVYVGRFNLLRFGQLWLSYLYVSKVRAKGELSGGCIHIEMFCMHKGLLTTREYLRLISYSTMKNVHTFIFCCGFGTLIAIGRNVMPYCSIWFSWPTSASTCSLVYWKPWRLCVCVRESFYGTGLGYEVKGFVAPTTYNNINIFNFNSSGNTNEYVCNIT